MTSIECSGCNISYIDFILLSENENELLNFLKKHGVSVDSKKCENCGNDMTLSGNGTTWRCQKSIIKNKKKVFCNSKLSAKTSTFFSGSHLPIKLICRFVYSYLFINHPKTDILQNEFKIARQTVIDREVFVFWAYENSAKIIGGPGKTVEIDEAKFGKRKYNRGRIVDGQWVFGGIERESKKMFILAVPDRTANTLIKIIKERVAPGTKIISDCWRAYDALEDCPEYEYTTVNHSENFVDPGTGAHTKNIERSWRDAREKIPRFGRKEQHFEGYLAEYLFCRKFSIAEHRYCEMFKAIGSLYNPKNMNNIKNRVERLAGDESDESNEDLVL